MLLGQIQNHIKAFLHYTEVLFPFLNTNDYGSIYMELKPIYSVVRRDFMFVHTIL